MKIKMILIVTLLLVWGIITFLLIYILINNPDSQIINSKINTNPSGWWRIGISFFGTIVSALMVIYAVNSSNKNTYDQILNSKLQVDNQIKKEKLNALVDFEYLFYDFDLVMTKFGHDLKYLNGKNIDDYNSECKLLFSRIEDQLIELEYNPKSLMELSYRGRKAYRGLYLEYKRFSTKVKEYVNETEFSKSAIIEDFSSVKVSEITKRIRIIGFETELLRRDVENLGEISDESEWFNGLYIEPHENGFLINMKRYPKMKVWNENTVDENTKFAEDKIKLKYELLESKLVSKIDIQEALTRARYNFKRAYVNKVFKHTGDEPWVWGAVVE